MKGVILAAGYATRFLPASKTIPKEMFPLIDRPVIDFIVQEMVDSGIEDVLLVSSRRKKVLEDFNLEIGSGLGVFAGKVWRIGLMGYSARKENVSLCISALKECLAY